MAIIVPVALDEMKAETFATPVANQLNSLVWSAWQPLTLVNSWSNYPGYAVASVRKNVGMDLLQVRGMVTGGAQATTIATLPAGYRPATTYELLTYVYGGSIGFAQLVVYNDGRLTLNQAVWATGLTGSLFCTVPFAA